MDNGNIPIIGQSDDPQKVFERGVKVIICSVDGNKFAWYIHNELAARISQKDADELVKQFRDSLKFTAAKGGNILR